MTLASGSVTATVGIACASVHSRSRALASSRDRTPVITTKIRTIPASMPKMPSFRRDTGELCSVGMLHLRMRGGFAGLPPVYHTEHDGNKQQRRDGCEDQPADHGAAERRILLAALAQPKRHRRHADDHGKRR